MSNALWECRVTLVTIKSSSHPAIECLRRLNSLFEKRYGEAERNSTSTQSSSPLCTHYHQISHQSCPMCTITRGRDRQTGPSRRCWAEWSLWGTATGIFCPQAQPSLVASSSGLESLFVSWRGHPDNEETRQLVIMSSIKYSVRK